MPRELQSMPRSECPAWASPVSRSFALCIAAISGKKIKAPSGLSTSPVPDSRFQKTKTVSVPVRHGEPGAQNCGVV